MVSSDTIYERCRSQPIEDVEILEMYGNNILKVSTADNGFELSRYSKRLTPKFNLAVSELEQLVPEKEEGFRR